jgi:hypothetical protein
MMIDLWQDGVHPVVHAMIPDDCEAKAELAIGNYRAFLADSYPDVELVIHYYPAGAG